MGEITNKDVNKVLRELVWPPMKDYGFTHRTQRTAWRDRPDQVEVVTFWSHNAYNAGALRVTTLSFQIMLGVYPRFWAKDDMPQKNGQLRPQEYLCDFRRMLHTPFKQQETARPEIWFVRSDGSNLREIVSAAREALLSEGLRWFDSLDGLERLLTTARTSPEDMSGTWGLGNLGSPNRRELVAVLEAEVAARKALT